MSLNLDAAPPPPMSPNLSNTESNEWPAHPETAKTIVLCLDGTGIQFREKNSNVLKIFHCLVKDQPDKQVVYYQTGVGTQTQKSLSTPLTGWISSKVDSAFGWYLDEHVVEAYRFIQDHYIRGDRICIFGFSRGAYTSRALCGFLHAIGILPKGNHRQTEYAYEVWKSGDQVACFQYRRMMTYDVTIDFVGCFDTVASVGAVIPRVLPFSTHNGKTKVFRHALSLDEWRVKFRQETWHYSLPVKEFDWSDTVWEWTFGLALEKLQAVRRLVFSGDSDRERDINQMAKEIMGGYIKGDEYCKVQLASVYSRRAFLRDVEDEEAEQREVDVKEVWFAGAHSDVGGGEDYDFLGGGLAQIPLRWMLKEALKSNCGILFDNDRLLEYGPYLRRFVEPAPPPGTVVWYESQDEIRKRDIAARSRAHIWSKIPWFPMELLMFFEQKQSRAGKWRWVLRMNRFRPRQIPVAEPPSDPVGKAKFEAAKARNDPQGPLFHISVKERMELDSNDPANQDVYSYLPEWLYLRKGSYRPKAWPVKGEPIWVEE